MCCALANLDGGSVFWPGAGCVLILLSMTKFRAWLEVRERGRICCCPGCFIIVCFRIGTFLPKVI